MIKAVKIKTWIEADIIVEVPDHDLASEYAHILADDPSANKDDVYREIMEMEATNRLCNRLFSDGIYATVGNIEVVEVVDEIDL